MVLNEKYIKNNSNGHWLCLVRCESQYHIGDRLRLVQLGAVKRGCGISKCRNCTTIEMNKTEKHRTQYSLSQKGKKRLPHSVETKIKISSSLSGRSLSQSTKNLLRDLRTGVKHTDESRLKMSKNSALRGKFGSKHPNWNPDLSPEDRMGRLYLEKYKVWVHSVMKRDSYTCQITGLKGGNLSAHHLDGWHWCIENRYNINNGITINKSIHELFHMIFGNRNNTKEQFTEFVVYIKEVLCLPI